jgi:hypothetical protein
MPGCSGDTLGRKTLAKEIHATSHVHPSNQLKHHILIRAGDHVWRKQVMEMKLVVSNGENHG